MSLPHSRNITYVAASVNDEGSMIRSQDLNEIQDWIVELYADSNGERSVRSALSVWGTSTANNTGARAIWDPKFSRWVSVYFLGAEFVGLYFDYPGASSDAAATHPDFAFSAQNPAIATDGNGTILIVVGQATATQTRVLRSVDGGENWAQQNLPNTYTGQSLLYWSGSAFVLIQGQEGSVFSSPSGISGSWTARTAIVAGQNLFGGHAFGGTLAITVQGAGGQDVIVTADNGVTWQQLDKGVLTANSVTYSSALKKWVFAGSGIWTADTPGGAWTSQVLDVRAPGTGEFFNLGNMGGTLVARRDGRVLTSRDATIWTAGLRDVPGSITVGPRGVAFYDGGTSLLISASV